MNSQAMLIGRSLPGRVVQWYALSPSAELPTDHSEMCALRGDDRRAGLQTGDKRTPPSAASEWTGELTKELEAWGWSTVDPATYSCKMIEHWNIPEAMRSLGLNGKSQTEGGDNACYRIERWNPMAGTAAINQWYTVDGIDYQVCMHSAILCFCHTDLTHGHASPLRVRHQPRWRRRIWILPRLARLRRINTVVRRS